MSVSVSVCLCLCVCVCGGEEGGDGHMTEKRRDYHTGHYTIIQLNTYITRYYILQFLNDDCLVSSKKKH